MFVLSGLIRRGGCLNAAAAAATLGWLLSPASAQQMLMQHDHVQMKSDDAAKSAAPTDHSSHREQPPKKTRAKKKKSDAEKSAGADHHDHPARPSENAGHGGMGGMKGFLGPYAMTREGSGTSWVPDTTPHEGIHNQFGSWMTMWHAQFAGIYDNQGGPRGGDKAFLGGMFMGMAQRPLGDGTLGFRAMLSPEPFMGPNGYPLLLATGETADGRTHLVDRQHPHDLFMELATTYSHPLSVNSSAFIYAGLPGEPALGPPAFMHRISGMDIPEAPITHHWLDSTHITFGVVTAGLVLNAWKIEASTFRGREPDQYRYDIEAPRLDSYSARLSWNPIRELSLQVSWGHLRSPEQLEPNRNEDRFTASAIYTQPFGSDNLWSTTLAWGRKMNRPGNTLDGFVLESAVILQKTYTLFTRAERVQEDELVEVTPPVAAPVYTVNKISLGGIYDFYRTEHAKLGVGGLVSFYGLPGGLSPLYGDPTSYMVFARLKIQ